MIAPTLPEFFHEPGIHIRFNPRTSINTAGLTEFVRDTMGIDSAIILATSGTSGSGPKFVVLKKAAMLASARAVNQHLRVTKDDRWLAALTLFHVGGLSVYARASLSGSEVVTVDDPLQWDKTGSEFTSAIQENDITITALTPIHLNDVVKNKQHAPPTLRGVLIGGGALSPALATRAIDLGWPIWPTYGMTETCSQIATSTDPRDAITGWIPFLPGWQIKGVSGIFSVRGDALFSGYVTRGPDREWAVQLPFKRGGWFQTGDRVELRNENQEMQFISRHDDLVKSLGELVSVQMLENRLTEMGFTGVVFPIPDERRGHRFRAVVEGEATSRINTANKLLAPFERIDEIIEVAKLPRTAVGKIAKGELSKFYGS